MAWGQLALAAAAMGGSMLAGSQKQKNTGYSKGDLDYIASVRSREIESFSQQLAQARSRYMSRLPQFQNFAFNQFMPEAEAAYAGRGLQVSGGAFGSALGKKAAEFQNQGMLDELNMEREDANSVSNAMGQLRAAQLGGGYNNMQGQQGMNPLASGLGQVAYDLFSDGLDRGTMPWQSKAAPASRMGMGNLNLPGLPGTSGMRANPFRRKVT